MDEVRDVELVHGRDAMDGDGQESSWREDGKGGGHCRRRCLANRKFERIKEGSGAYEHGKEGSGEVSELAMEVERSNWYLIPRRMEWC